MARFILDVLYEDNHLLAINKPAGIATMGAQLGTPTIVQIAKDYLKKKYKKPGNVYLGVVSRLDAPVSGVLLLARTSKAARRLSQQFAGSVPRKVYLAVVHGPKLPDEGLWIDWVSKDDAARKMIVEDGPNGGRRAELAYRVLKRHGKYQLLQIELRTGRKHQIRLQCAHRGCTILGDRKYGSDEPFGQGIALHAARLVVQHPVRGEPLELEAPVPASWKKLPWRV